MPGPVLPRAALVLHLDPQARRAHAGADDEAATPPTGVTVEDGVGDEFGQTRHCVRGRGTVAQDLGEELPGLPDLVRTCAEGADAGARASGRGGTAGHAHGRAIDRAHHVLLAGRALRLTALTGLPYFS
jgi:hypothetical protein